MKFMIFVGHFHLHGKAQTYRTKYQISMRMSLLKLISQVLPLAEALAIRAAISYAHHLDISKIWLCSDSQELIRASNSITKPKNLHWVLSDIESPSSSFDFFVCSFLSRDQNVHDDCLAKVYLSNYISSWAYIGAFKFGFSVVCL